MRALLIHPSFPDTFWSYRPVLDLIGKKALIPPLGLVTVAAMLPKDWELNLVDLSIREVREDEWQGVDLVMLTGMIVQRDFMLEVIAEARRRGIPVVVGGPYVSSVPEVFDKGGADYLVMDEAEISLQPFLDHLAEHGPRQRDLSQPAVRFGANGQKPALTDTPVPRYDLLDMHAYDAMSVQYSRGCPFLCEFCDIITLYGRRPRTKANGQIIAELERLEELGWRGGIFLVDDNFIGNKPNVKKLLPELRDWQARHGNPFWLDTEASIDLAADPEMVAMMVEAGFASVFIGIETPDEESLALTKKQQNTRAPMQESIDFITRAGLRVMCGMIIGFDNEKPGAGQRIVDFCQQTAIPTAILSMLQVLPNTGLYTRLEKEGRLVEQHEGSTLDNDGMNFIPTRPAAEIAREFAGAIQGLFDPEAYMDRCFNQFVKLGKDKPTTGKPLPAADQVRKRTRGQVMRAQLQDLRLARAGLVIVWRQGVKRSTRRKFWSYLRQMRRENPKMVVPYLAILSHIEHFLPHSKNAVAKVEAAMPMFEKLPVAADLPKPAPVLPKVQRKMAARAAS